MSATIVIPTYDAQETLGAAIESALAQDYEPVEVIVVDDGSTDGTATVARAFHGRIRYVRQENAGPSAARNRGISEARGEFVAFLDADDEAPPTKLSVQVGYLVAHPDVACVVGRHELVGDAPEWFDADSVPLISLVARRSTLADLGGFDTSLRIAEDRDLLVRMRERGLRVEFLPDVVLRRCFHVRNLSHERPDEHPVFRSLKAKLDRAREEKR
jgi:glycosyltransferase involved in cell wall biosynthesis